MREMLAEYYRYVQQVDEDVDTVLSLSKWLDLLGNDAQFGYVVSGNVEMWDLDRLR